MCTCSAALAAGTVVLVCVSRGKSTRYHRHHLHLFPEKQDDIEDGDIRHNFVGVSRRNLREPEDAVG